MPSMCRGRRLSERVLAAGIGALAILGMAAPAAHAGKWREQVHPLISGKDEILEDVVAIGARDVWAVGHIFGVVGAAFEFRTHVLHWDGFTWLRSASVDVEGAPATNLLYGVDARSANDVWAVGYYRRPGEPSKTLIEHWDGTAWSIVGSPNPSTSGNYLQAVAITIDGDAWAVGTSVTSFTELPLTLHWNGAFWLQIEVPQPSFCAGNTYLTDVAARRPNNVLASGYCDTASGDDQGFILRWNGRKWRVVAGPDQIPPKSQLQGITFVSATEIWAVGASPTLSPLILHWDGSAWATVPPPANAGPNAYLQSVDAKGSDNVWAVGIGQSPQPPFAGVFSTHWDGAQWTTVPAGDFGSLSGVAMAGRKVWAVGQRIDDSLILMRRD
jgi:hypothetical protein